MSVRRSPNTQRCSTCHALDPIRSHHHATRTGMTPNRFYPSSRGGAGRSHGTRSSPNRSRSRSTLATSPHRRTINEPNHHRYYTPGTIVPPIEYPVEQAPKRLENKDIVCTPTSHHRYCKAVRYPDDTLFGPVDFNGNNILTLSVNAVSLNTQFFMLFYSYK